MIKECKKGYDVDIRKIGKQINIILPYENGNTIKCKTEKCPFIDVCEYKDYISKMDKE